MQTWYQPTKLHCGLLITAFILARSVLGRQNWNELGHGTWFASGYSCRGICEDVREMTRSAGRIRAKGGGA